MLKPRNGGSIWEDTELVRWEKYIEWRFETPILDTSHFIVLIITLSNTCFSFKESSTRVLNLQASLQDPTLLSNLNEVSCKLESMPISWRLLHVASYEWKIQCVHWVEWVQEWHKWMREYTSISPNLRKDILCHGDIGMHSEPRVSCEGKNFLSMVPSIPSSSEPFWSYSWVTSENSFG